MELRKRLGHREDVACVFEPAKPSEVLQATRRLTETIATFRLEKARGSEAETRLGAERGRIADRGSSMSNLDNLKPRVGVSSENLGDSSKTFDALRGMSVLLVEDNLMNQQMVKHSVVKCGVALDVAGDGAEAVALVEARLGENSPRVYDAILMDMMMPVKDGATATREIRACERELAKNNSGFFADGKRKRHVIIGLSANVGPAFVTEVRAAGMDGAVSKPFYPATLRRALLEVRTGAYQGFNPNTKKDENKGEVHGSNSIAAGDATGGFVEDAFGDDAKKSVEGTRSSAA
jgi:CheY-like chemotaxis protein